MKPLRVCLDARLKSDAFGGVLQVIIGLAHGLSQLTDGDEEYYFLTYADDNEWLRPYLGGACRLLNGPVVPAERSWKKWLKANIPMVGQTWNYFSSMAGKSIIEVEKSDGTIEKAGIDLMHFTKQGGFLTGVPSIYQPHDLQHLHLPQYFHKRSYLIREVTYRKFCEQASMVAVTSSWSKQDLWEHYHLPEEKVQVIPLAPVLTAYETPTDDDLADAIQKFSLPDAFIFYPAQTWEHKNHLGLFEALAYLKEHYNCRVPFVSSGARTDFFPKILETQRQLGLTDQVQFLGFVSSLELQCLYKLCRGVIIPTKFEAASFPLWEAFLAEKPAACSNVTSLPLQAGDAALIFDPYKPKDIAAAIYRLWTEKELRQTLVKKGKMRVAQFTWDRTVRLFRAHYRRIAGRGLSEEDREFLQSPPML